MDNGCLHALLGDACLCVERVSEAADALETALATTPAGRTFFYEPELHRLRGELLLGGAERDEAAAEESFRRALDIAGDLGARSLQLRAALSLGRLLARRGRDADAHELVGGVYGGFTEGFETSDLVTARKLIEELTPRPADA
jgi:predicted ATPase